MRRKLERAERQRDIERERTRIARDIHDDLGAQLTRITMVSESVSEPEADPQRLAEGIRRIYATARELTRSLDEIVWAVNPRHDRLDSLANYLSRFANEYLSAADIRCRLEVPLQLPSVPVPADVRHNLFLAFKEALNNIVKHAAASEVRVELKFNLPELALLVSDNGRGFAFAGSEKSPGAQADRIMSGNGLPNMKRRITEIGGVCEIFNEPGKGAKVKFTLPLLDIRNQRLS